MADTHHPKFPSVGIRTFGRKLSLLADPTRDAWCSVVQEEGKRAEARVKQWNADRLISTWSIPESAQCQSTSLIGVPGGPAILVWNAVHDGQWGIYAAPDLRAGTTDRHPMVVHRSDGFCLGPAGVSDGRTTALCWSEGNAGRIRVMLSTLDGTDWATPIPISPADADAFRPALCIHGGNVVLAWDEYRDGAYGVRVCLWDSAAATDVCYLARTNENWFAPHLLDHGGQAYVAWLASQKVAHKRGIVDHACYGLVGRIAADGVELLQDGVTTSSQAVADLREGLLAMDRHYNYDGLRRKPRLVPGVGERIWCVWERLPAGDGTVHSGEFVGREYDPASRHWGTVKLLHGSGCGYAVSSPAPGRLCLAYLRSEHNCGCADIAVEEIALNTDTLALARMLPSQSWRHWSPRSRFRAWQTDDTVEVGAESLRLYWMDTHCHGNFSPDAEGDVDELIHYARDVAQLDGVCITDNDYYPAKALTPAEWEVHQEFASHYTEPGRFITFPGYEYTFWGASGINHRILLYPPGHAGALRRRIDPESATVSDLLRCLASEPCPPVCYAHHTTYDLQDDPLDQLVEVCSSWRVCMAETDFTRRQLAAGRRFGFIGSSDTHRAVPGMGGSLTGVYAESLEPDKILAALRQRRTIATQGVRMFADFRVNGAFVGEETTTESVPVLFGSLKAPRLIERVDIYRDADVIHQLWPSTRDVRFEFEDARSPLGRNCYFLQIKLRGSAGFNVPPSRNSPAVFASTGDYPHNLAKREGCYAWISPVWITRL